MSVVGGVLFDSGDTLVRPIGGRWNPRFDFEELVFRYEPQVNAADFAEAFEEGERALSAGASTTSRADYHKAILRVLGVPNPSPELLVDLERPLDRPVVEPFPDARGTLQVLHERGIRMAVVSDNWPSLEDLYRDLDLHRFFDAFVISAVLGFRKPDPRMYRAGSDALDLAPQQCVYVDDDPELVAAAIQLGYRGVVINRSGSGPTPSVPDISGLAELEGIVSAAS